ncbi:PD-(D/E)XK nuclease-like domain-containing protein [Oceanobacillus locisalsi]|uniref:PD-(D/E)XK nuclease-like domain-containing protein n=1 Tax=Oceanobacillus locisalsi TaxID=546107 RepID=A0ABW3NJ38_9BACI
MTATANKQALTSVNYYSRDSDMQYMSVSQFKKFVECEAESMAYLNGEVDRQQNKAMQVGSYIHAAFESDDAFNQFIEENSSSILKKNGGKYADFEKADQIIETLKEDNFAMFAMTGEKERIFTANLFGVDWKIKVDNVNPELGFFSDLKTTRDIHQRFWSNKYGGWVSFVEQWDYVLQMAMYRKVIEESTGLTLTPYIVAVTKEDIPNKAVIHFDESRFQFEYEYVELMLERIVQVKNGDVEPVGCGKCDYCKSKKKLNNTIEVGELIYE